MCNFRSADAIREDMKKIRTREDHTRLIKENGEARSHHSRLGHQYGENVMIANDRLCRVLGL